MIKTDENALICDLAETYGIFDFRALPVSLLATLAVGLRENSRIKMKLGNMVVAPEIMLLASAVDSLAFLVWSKTEDAQNNMNRPKSIVRMLCGDNPENTGQDAIMSFETAEDFEAERETILRRIT